MNEIFKDIQGYEGFYQVSNLGRVYSCISHKFRKLCINSKGYADVCLAKHGVHKNHLVHRLVAKAFIPNPENKPTVNHKLA